MDRTALFLLGFAITLGVTATAEMLGLHVGSEVEHTATALFVMALAALPARAIATRVSSERVLLLLWLIAGIATMGLPRVASAASWIASHGIDPPRGDWRGLFSYAFFALCAAGPFVLLWSVALFARLDQLARSAESDTTDLGPAAALFGGSIALAVGPYLITHGLGMSGSIRFAGAFFMTAAALRFAAGGPERLRASEAMEHFVPNELLGAAAIALGGVLGRTSAFLDIRGQGSEVAAFVGPLAATLGLSVVFAVLSPFVAPNRLSGQLAEFAPRLLLGAALGRILPRPADSTLVTLSALLALATSLAILGFAVAWRRGPMRARGLGIISILGMLGGFGFAHSSLESERDGSVFALVTSPIDGRTRPYLEGAPVIPLDVAPDAAARAVAIGLTHIDEPRRCAVLGIGGEPFADALARATQSEVTFVTPLEHEARTLSALAKPYSIVNATERIWLERLAIPYDLILLAPPARSPRRIAKRSTVEFGRLLLSRLESDGVAIQAFHLGSNDAVELFQCLLPTAGFVDYRLFLDHPLNPTPFLLRVIGRGSTEPFLERAERRLREIGTRLPELSAHEFDLRTLVQSFAFDRPILDLWYRESWQNTDDRCRLSGAISPPAALDPDARSRIRAGIEQRRISLGNRLRGSADESSLFLALDDTIRRDHEAVHELATIAFERARNGESGLQREWLPSSAESERLLSAMEYSPELELIARPLDRAWRMRFERGEFALASGLLQRMLASSPNHLIRRMYFADAAERCGRLRAARDSYLAVLAIEPEHPSANLRLAYVLAGRGRSERAEALTRIERAITLDRDRLAEMDVLRASFVYEMLRGNVAAAREIDARIPPAERVGPLLPVLRLRLLE